MKRLLSFAVVVTLGACASTDPGAMEKNPKELQNEAIEDFVKVSELEPADSIRIYGQLRHEVITEHYVVIRDSRNTWLVAFVRRCHDLEGPRVKADVRHNAQILRARFDTIRGCRIGEIYPLSDGMQQELEELTRPYE